jgi:hypothetical protein
MKFLKYNGNKLAGNRRLFPVFACSSANYPVFDFESGCVISSYVFDEATSLYLAFNLIYGLL